jgi:glycogen debranching enzyme
MPTSEALQTEYAVVARASRPGPLPFVLKDAETFAIFDPAGDIPAAEDSELGIFHDGMRYLSRLQLRLWGRRPLLLSSGVREDNCLLTAHLTNPDMDDVAGPIAKGTLYVHRSTVVTAMGCGQRIRLTSFAEHAVEAAVSLRFDADFRDIFEVRGSRRKRRGTLRPPQRLDDGLRIAYSGLDGRERITHVRIGPAGVVHADDGLAVLMHLAPHDTAELFIGITFGGDVSPDEPLAMFNGARRRAIDRYEAACSDAARIRTSNELFNDWLSRSFADIHLLATPTPGGHGLYPYAGVPWFSCPFGRDGLITARQMLIVEPNIARGVLGYLAQTQAEEEDPERDAEPGKILHETRLGEMAAIGEIPFGRYYGTADATPLFIMLAGDYLRRTGDIEFIRAIWPNVELALHWIERYGDLDGDGYVEYERHSPNGLVNQGWKDSHDSIFHADGSDPAGGGGIALCEVQGYVFAAKRAAAEMARAFGKRDQARTLVEQADRLRSQFEKDFWCKELGTYVLALDGRKKPCRVISSNAGHALFAAIASEKHAAGVAQSLLTDGSFSGWGVRTVDCGAARYNPMSYHNGSVWPHDNALIALGFARYGFKDAVLKLMDGLFHAAMFMPMHRMPELFCGFARQPAEGPTMYPVACLPQAWASGAVFALLEACLGLNISFDAHGRPLIVLDKPVLPPFIDEIEIRNLTVGGDALDMVWHRYHDDVTVSVIRRPPGVDVIVRK